MSQMAQSFDAETIRKIKHSALISLAGFVVAALPMLLPQILDMLQGNPMAAAFVGAAGPWIVNTVREWMKGQE